MLRLPSTTIVLGQADLDEFERRQREYYACQVSHQCSELAAVSAFDSANGSNNWKCQGTYHEIPRYDRNLTEKELDASSGQQSATRLRHTHIEECEESCLQQRQLHRSSTNVGLPYGFQMAMDEGICFPVTFDATLEGDKRPGRRCSTLSTDDFHCGGLLEGLKQEPTSNQYGRSMLALRIMQSPESDRRLDLCRSVRDHSLSQSSLYWSQIAPSSLKHRPTSQLTPRVNSRISTYGSTGIFFQHPPRRPEQRHLSFQHQTNSFSFDCSERSDAAYEQNRVSSISPMTSVPRLETNVKLNEELGGISLTGSRSSSLRTRRSSLERSDIRDQSLSTEDHNTRNATVPSLSQFFNVQQNALTDKSIALCAELQPPLRATTDRSEDGTALNPSPTGSPGTSAPHTAIGLLRSAARFISAYRHHSPSGRQGSPEHSSPSLTPPPRKSRNSPSYRLLFRTSSRICPVYNDQLAPHTQPQTPADAPEARHQSRFHPLNTAPGFRASTRSRVTVLGNDGGTSTDLFSHHLRSSFATLSHTARDRDRSPAGLVAAGFRGLYGGRENGDEEQSWLDGIWFSNAETRLWSVGMARNQE